MKKKTSLINLSNNEIKKNEQKETLAGQHGQHRLSKNGSGGGLLAAEPWRCSTICFCEGDPGFSMGMSQLEINWELGIQEW